MSRSRLDATVQLLIPPSLVLLLVLTIVELFYGLEGLRVWVDIFDAYIIIIFAIDLYYRWQDRPKLWPFIKAHYLDIVATIPFNFIFYGVQGLTLIAALRGVRIISRVARLSRFTRLVRLIRVVTRAPRFLRVRKHVKKAKIRKVQPHEREMKGVLSFKVILLITINSIMGTGIYFLTAAGAKHAGPASLISWGVLSIISLYIAMCFSELTAMFPKAGGVYEFAKQAYGRFWSFVIGWSTAIAGSVTIAMLLLGALQYLIPDHPQYYLPAAWFLIVLFNAVAYNGMKTSTVMLVSFALITLGTMAALIVPAAFNIDPANYSPFFVFPTFTVVLTIFFIAETFFGWESAVFLSAETKNPAKVMPRALIYGTLVIALLSFALSLSAMGVIPWREYGQSVAPLRDLGGALFGAPGAVFFTIMVFVSIIGAVACWVATAPRLLMAIAEDRLFFVQFAKIHPKHKSPYVSIGFQTVLLSILVWVGSGSYETLLHMLIPLILFIYSAVLLSVVILRFKRPSHKRPFSVPLGRVGPVLVVLFMAFLLAMFIRETHGALEILKISASLVLFGVPAYFFIELFYDSTYVTLRRNVLARVGSLLHHTPLPRRAYRRMLSLVKARGKERIIDYNSPYGGLSAYAARRGLDMVHVSASREEARYLKRALGEVEVHTARPGRLPRIKGDVFISYNDLAYLDDVESFLERARKVLPKKGKFCFYVSHHFLNVARNALLLEDDKAIRGLLARHGLKARVKRHKGLFSEEIFIHGKRGS